MNVDIFALYIFSLTLFLEYPRKYVHIENYIYISLKSQLYIKKNNLIHAKLAIFINPRKFIHARISTFTVLVIDLQLDIRFACDDLQ